MTTTAHKADVLKEKKKTGSIPFKAVIPQRSVIFFCNKLNEIETFSTAVNQGKKKNTLYYCNNHARLLC